jgi:transcriptional regulator with XRE-family HTH domain
MDTSEGVYRKWEAGVTPMIERFPAIIAFLGFEPWGEATTLPDRLRAERRRRGVTIDQAAGLLGVDASTLWWWENGRKPHRVADRQRIEEFVGHSPKGPTVPDPGTPKVEVHMQAPLGQCLRDRRKELGLSQVQAAESIGVNAWTWLSWENDRRTPNDRYYPALIKFLGYEPWPSPSTTGERLRAERLRRGLSRQQLAAVMQVDEGSVSAWEDGAEPRHDLSKAKVEAFLTGAARPRRQSPRRAITRPQKEGCA